MVADPGYDPGNQPYESRLRTSASALKWQPLPVSIWALEASKAQAVAGPEATQLAHRRGIDPLPPS